MPLYDKQCPHCDWKGEVWAKVGEAVECPKCGGTTETYWQSRVHSVIQDEFAKPMGLTPYDQYLMDSGRAHEATIMHSHSERRRLMAERGLRERIDHVGLAGSDKSPHTTSWASGPPPGHDPRPFCMLSPEEQAQRHREWMATETERAEPVRLVTLDIPDLNVAPSFASTIAKLIE